MHKRDVSISAIKPRLKVAIHKYGVELPTSYSHAKKLDINNGNHLWIESHVLEIYNVCY